LERFSISFPGPRQRHRTSVGVGLGALLSVPLGLIRIWHGERQTWTTEQGHVTVRLTKAIEQLGAEKALKRIEFRPHYKNKDGKYLRDENNVPIPHIGAEGKPIGEWLHFEETVPNLEVRLGAIYALERIAQDSKRDHIPVMETLCAYIRENGRNRMDEGVTAKLRERDPDAIPWYHPPRIDVQAALSVIGRRSIDQVAYEQPKGYRLDLSEAAIAAADIQRARLGRALLVGAKLQRAHLGEAQLQQANFLPRSVILPRPGVR